MLDNFPVAIIVGSILGFMSGLGIGGGTLLILWLTMVLGTDPTTSRLMNLMFFIPSAIIACVFRWKKGTLNVKQLLPAILTGCIGAGISSGFADDINEVMLKKMFGIILLAAGLREIFYHEKKDN